MGDILLVRGRTQALVALLFTLAALAQGLMVRRLPGDDGVKELLRRVKRGWVWNQFFVLEEYTGLEPLYIGKVRDT